MNEAAEYTLMVGLFLVACGAAYAGGHYLVADDPPCRDSIEIRRTDYLTRCDEGARIGLEALPNDRYLITCTCTPQLSPETPEVSPEAL